jgi:preprotein translocase subunit SecB
METKKIQFELISIVNVESFFKRDYAIDDNYENVVSDVDMNVTSNIGDESIGVFLTVTLKQHFEGTNNIEAKIVTAGLFKQKGEHSQQVIDSFCNINAPAIIFPFVREAIANLSMKAGIQPILIQPVNFIELSRKEDDRKS